MCYNNHWLTVSLLGTLNWHHLPKLILIKFIISWFYPFFFFRRKFYWSTISHKARLFKSLRSNYQRKDCRCRSCYSGLSFIEHFKKLLWRFHQFCLSSYWRILLEISSITNEWRQGQTKESRNRLFHCWFHYSLSGTSKR